MTTATERQNLGETLYKRFQTATLEELCKLHVEVAIAESEGKLTNWQGHALHVLGGQTRLSQLRTE